MTLDTLWTPDTLFFLIVGLGAIVLGRKAWAWKQALDRCDVTTHEPPQALADPQHEFHRTVGSLHGPQSKGFQGQLRDPREIDDRELDRRAHVHALQRRRPS